jgi:hypothetical protein
VSKQGVWRGMMMSPEVACGPSLYMPCVSQNYTFINLVGPIRSLICGGYVSSSYMITTTLRGPQNLKGSGVQCSEEMREEGVKFYEARSFEVLKFQISSYHPSAWSQPMVT